MNGQFVMIFDSDGNFILYAEEDDNEDQGNYF